MYVKLEEGTARYYAIEDLRIDHPNVSFPAIITNEIAASFDVFPCGTVNPPVIDHTQNIAVGPPVLVGESWVQSWDVTEATPEEINQRVSDQWAGIRSERNSRLSASDWTQLSDAPVDAAVWAVYRQELRDITKQADPFAIVWPVEPA